LGENLSVRTENITVFADYPDVISVDELCCMLHVSSVTAYKMLKNEEIECLRIGHVYKIPKVNVLKFLHLIS
jgi:excisionase family DNA binding protein